MTVPFFVIRYDLFMGFYYCFLASQNTVAHKCNDLLKNKSQMHSNWHNLLTKSLIADAEASLLVIRQVNIFVLVDPNLLVFRIILCVSCLKIVTGVISKQLKLKSSTNGISTTISVSCVTIV